jgi:hypothetical protein
MEAVAEKLPEGLIPLAGRNNFTILRGRLE